MLELMPRIGRRRRRRKDNLASRESVRNILIEIRLGVFQNNTFELNKIEVLLRAARHVSRYSASDTRRGRPSPWDRPTLIRARNKTESVLARETMGRVSFESFVDHYLRISVFPTEVVETLERGELNLFEAEQLARIESSRDRNSIMDSHIRGALPCSSLRARVNEYLATPIEPPDGELEIPQIDERDEESPYDPSHLFWEELRRLSSALRVTRKEDLSDADINDLSKALDGVWQVLYRMQSRRTKRAPRLPV